MVARRRVRQAALAAALLALAWPAAAASSSNAAPEPYQIQSASLTQNGQLLVWQVQLAQPLAAKRLARQHRSLCLLIERVASRAVRGQVCVTGPGRGASGARIEYIAVSGGTPGQATVIAAAVTQPDPSKLTASFLPGAVGLGYGKLRWQTASAITTPKCSRSPEARCSVVYPARPALLKLHTPVLVGCVASGRSLVYDGSFRRREIALTFDDGPWDDPPTADFLQMLEREHVPATFFEIGDQISQYDPTGALERRMLSDGDMIGDHTWSHPDMARLSARKQRAQLLDAAAAIRRATGGFTPCLWRPPYGAITPSLVSLARSLGFLTVMWDVDPRDWALPGVGRIYANVVANAHPGAIVIQHFGGGPRYQTLAAVPKEIDTLRAAGYQFVTVAQLLGLKLVYR